MCFWTVKYTGLDAYIMSIICVDVLLIISLLFFTCNGGTYVILMYLLIQRQTYICKKESLDTKTHIFVLFLSGFSSSGVLDFQISWSNSVIEDPVYCWYSILFLPFLWMVLPYGRHNIKGQQHDHQEVIFRCY